MKYCKQSAGVGPGWHGRRAASGEPQSSASSPAVIAGIAPVALLPPPSPPPFPCRDAVSIWLQGETEAGGKMGWVGGVILAVAVMIGMVNYYWSRRESGRKREGRGEGREEGRRILTHQAENE